MFCVFNVVPESIIKKSQSHIKTIRWFETALCALKLKLNFWNWLSIQL